MFKDENGHGLFAYERITRLELEFNNTCNAFCGGCDRTLNDKFQSYGTRIMKLEHIKKFFPPEFVRQLTHVFSCGGYSEPSLHPHALDIFRYFREHGVKNISFSTNGGTRTPQWWAELAKVINGEYGYWGGRVTFSIDGLEDTNHLYKVGIKWERLMNNVKAFIDAGGRARWQFLISNANEHQLDDVKALAKSLGFDAFVEKVSFRTKQTQIDKELAEKLSEEIEHKLINGEGERLEISPDEIKKYKNINQCDLDLVYSPIKPSENEDNRHPYREIIDESLVTEEGKQDFVEGKKNIHCHNTHTGKIYVPFDGKLWPCNWFGCMEFSYCSSPTFWPLKQFEMYNIPEDFNNLYNYLDCDNPVKEILNHPFYTHLLEQDFYSEDRQPNKCKEMCHTEIGYGKFEAMRRNQQNLKTGEYSDVADIHGLLGPDKESGGTGVGKGSVKPVPENKGDDFGE